MKFSDLLLPLKRLFNKIFDKKTPISRIILALLTIIILVGSGLAYIIITDEEEVKIIKAEEKVETD